MIFFYEEIFVLDDDTSASNYDSSPDDDSHLSSDFHQTQVLLNELPQNTKVAESWETLQEVSFSIMYQT